MVLAVPPPIATRTLPTCLTGFGEGAHPANPTEALGLTLGGAMAFSGRLSACLFPADENKARVIPINGPTNAIVPGAMTRPGG